VKGASFLALLNSGKQVSKKNDWSVSNDKNNFAGTEQKLRERTPEEVRLGFGKQSEVMWT